MKLLISAIIKYVFGVLLVGLFVFLPAGTFNFSGGILFMLIMFLPILIFGIILFVKAPNLLKKRLNGREDDKTQKAVLVFFAIIFVVGFVLAGLDFRFGWSKVPTWLTALAAVLFLLSYGLYAEVVRENAYLSRKIEVQENQKVIDNGLYGVIRHPMYAVTILLFLNIPIILGSWLSFLVFLFYPIIIAVRIKAEEELLTKELQGYTEYKQRVKYRLLPFVW